LENKYYKLWRSRLEKYDEHHQDDEKQDFIKSKGPWWTSQTHLENFHIRSTVMNTIIWKISSTNHNKQDEKITKIFFLKEHEKHQMIHLESFHRKARGPKWALLCKKQALQTIKNKIKRSGI
jgi:hypothetical protein